MENNLPSPTSPASPIGSPASGFAPLPTVLVLAGAIALNLLAVLGYIFGATLLGAISIKDARALPAFQTVLAQLFSYIPLIAYVLVALPYLAKRSLRELGFRAPTASDIAFGALGALAMTVVVDVAGNVMVNLTHNTQPEAAIALLSGLHGPLERATFDVMAVVFAPLAEELLFRVFIFNALERYVPTNAAIVVSAVVFGASHVTSVAQFATVALPLALGGCILAYIYARTRCYWASVITHALFNGITAVSFFVFHVKT